MAPPRHKRETPARDRKFRLPKAALVAVPLATVVTASAVTVGVLTGGGLAPADSATGSGPTASVGAALTREGGVSRSKERDFAKRARRMYPRSLAAMKAAEVAREARAATRRAVRNADTRLWTDAPLNLWTDETSGARQVGVIAEGEQVLVTGRDRNGRDEIVVAGQARWVSAGYLTDEKPIAGVAGACTNGTSVPSSVDPDLIKVHAAVCGAFPSITTYGTYRSDGEHAEGRAVDVMVSGSLGWAVAEFLRAHYAELGVEYLIYSQRIWSVERGGEGWRYMADRGSTTANHYDHVHVTVF